MPTAALSSLLRVPSISVPLASGVLGTVGVQFAAIWHLVTWMAGTASSACLHARSVVFFLSDPNVVRPLQDAHACGFQHAGPISQPLTSTRMVEHTGDCMACGSVIISAPTCSQRGHIGNLQRSVGGLAKERHRSVYLPVGSHLRRTMDQQCQKRLRDIQVSERRPVQGQAPVELD